MLSHDLAEDHINFASHVGGIAADVERGSLLKEFADKSGILAEFVLYIDFFIGLAGEGGENFEGVAELSGEFLCGGETVRGTEVENEIEVCFCSAADGTCVGVLTSNSSWYKKSSACFRQP